MHSSTSSSRIPAGSWPGTWILALVLVLTIVAGWEVFVRQRGLADTAVDDTAELWVRERERASTLGDRAVILVGASRMQMGVDLSVMQEYTDGLPIQLALSAAPFVPVLDHLARDDTITGTVIVSFTTQDLLWFTKDSKTEQWIAAYDDYKAGKTAVFYQPFEDRLRRWVDGQLVSFSKDARPQQLIFGSSIKNYVRTLPDRSQQADYSKVDRQAAYERRVELVLGNEEPVFKEISDLGARLAELESMIERIQSRGGRVVFVRLPSAHRIAEIEETRYPKQFYWDRIAATTSAETLHYAEHEELQGYDLPDGVHIDVSGQAEFTRALSKLIF